MPRLTKSDIEKALLTGMSVPWTEANGKSASIQLTSASQRRLFAYLLSSTIREVKSLSQTFIDGLAAAQVAAGDPAAPHIQQTVNPSASGPWKLQSLKVEGFGGVNVWHGKAFELALDGESLLLEGPNGSGKSSLIAAIIWALTGERPRDQGEGSPDVARPVYDLNGSAAGAWPPVAAYPPDVASLNAKPSVTVEVIFVNAAGTLASARRHFDGQDVSYNVDPALQIPTILLEAGVLMPARMPHLRLDDGKGRLTDAVQKLTGLDELIELGIFVQGLCHASRDYLAYKKSELASSQDEFDKQVERVRTALASVSVTVPNFKPSDTAQKDGPMATLGKQLNDKAAELIATVSNDLAKELQLADPEVQQQIAAALHGARQDVEAGLPGLKVWQLLETIASGFPANFRSNARAAIATAKNDIKAAIAFFEKQCRRLLTDADPKAA